MKKAANFLVLLTIFFITNSCSEQLEAITNCLGESAQVEIKYSLDPVNARKINYSIKYTGSGTLNSVKWTFGDGTTETVTGTKVTHTYETVGSYEVIADIKLRKETIDCNITPKKVVTVN
ncbi:PKD domain-containing protein [Flavobacterium sp. FlaQc-48]|uniref:PKD domain-containing protein n=1 Tax=Flavobacterium sp. FlaQc-48 TaxID=3374181 RepID=UPI0037578D4D